MSYNAIVEDNWLKISYTAIAVCAALKNIYDGFSENGLMALFSAPWYIVNADDKKEARLNVIKHFLSNMDYAKKEEKLLAFDRDIVFKFDPICYEKGLIKK